MLATGKRICAHLLQIPRDEWQAMGIAVGTDGAVVLRRPEQVAVAPGYRAGHERVRLGLLDRRRIGLRPAPRLVETDRIGMDVAVRGVPQHEFVVERVELHAPAGRRAERRLQVRDPCRDIVRCIRRRCIGGIVAGNPAVDAIAGRVDLAVALPVAGIAVTPSRLRVVVTAFIERLRSVSGLGIAPVDGSWMCTVELLDPADRRQCQQHLRCGRTGITDECVRIVGLVVAVT